MQIPFVKMEGIGNDFILVNGSIPGFPASQAWEAHAKKWCCRRFGIGADGLIVYCKSDTWDAKFRIYNSDGSEAEMCGNGMRCFAKYLYEEVGIKKTDYAIETRAGIIRPCVVTDLNDRVISVQVNMGAPRLTPGEIPFTAGGSQIVDVPLPVSWGTPRITAVSMGNPHAVIFVDNLQDLNLSEMGPPVETAPFFPEKTNVEFVTVINRSLIRMRVWERGAGETLACGTGACAAVVAAVLNGMCDTTVDVILPGGQLKVIWDKAGNRILKTGPARKVFEGYIENDPLDDAPKEES